MSYLARSIMMEEFTIKSPWLLRHAVLCRIWRVATWFLIPLSYLGALLAPAGILSIPFSIFHHYKLPHVAFWITTFTVGAFVAWAIYRSASHAVRGLRQDVIFVDAIILVIGFVAASVLIIWLFPPK